MASGGNKEPKPIDPNPIIREVGHQSLYEQLAEKKLHDFNAWETGAGAHDILEAPGMDHALDIYGSAHSLEAQDQLSNPALALSGTGNRGLADQAEMLHKSQLYNDRAEGLHNAFNQAHDDAYGMGANAAELEFRRHNAEAGLAAGVANSYWQRQAQKKPLWERIAGLAIGGLGAAGGLGGISGLFGGGSRGGGSGGGVG